MIVIDSAKIRGKRLFESFTGQGANVVDTDHLVKFKGRNKALMHNRNILCYYRFYYYSRIHKLRYEQVLSNLSNEFFLSVRTITDLIETMPESFFKEKPSLKELKINYPFYTWLTQLPE